MSVGDKSGRHRLPTDMNDTHVSPTVLTTLESTEPKNVELPYHWEECTVWCSLWRAVSIQRMCTSG